MTATVHPDVASQGVWDVVVVGAGPAGSLAALLLARCGASVLLVDRSHFPREKVCGCCINAGALRALGSAGLRHVLEDLSPPHIDGIRLIAGGAAAHLRLRGSVVMSRGRFDAALIAAAIGEGAHFLPGARVVASSVAGNFRRMQLSVRGSELGVKCRLAIDASGLSGAWTQDEQFVHRQSYIGLSAIGSAAIHRTPRDPVTVRMACGNQGYVGAVQLEDGRLNVSAAICPDHLRRAKNPAAAIIALFEDAGADAVPGIEQWQWKGTRHLTTRPRTIASERLLAIGDAAGYVEPFTGEGIEWALQSALLVAALAERAIEEWDERMVAQWREMHRRAFRWRHRRCRAVARLLRRPLLVHAAVRVARTVPSVGESIGNALHSRLSFA